MAKRLDKTLADYVVGGVMPALLMGLLCSLCYFLLELAYSGAYTGQLKWILFFFVVGTVLIARISMRGDISERAGLYGVGLAIAAGLAMIRYVEIPQSALGGFGWLIPVSLMSIIWWSAHKLTQDSTWEDEDDDDGGGLLDSQSRIDEANAVQLKSEAWFDQYQSEREEEQRKKKPGIMVVYFSLAALPLFGIGQAMIPASNIEARRYAFWLLTIYVGCGLGMLLTTSFLGLRRYLRGRRLQMPASMTALWLGIGSAMILTLMILSAVLLPRPEAEYHVSQLLGWATSKERDANQTHFFEGSSGKSDNQGSGPQNKNQPQQAGGNQQGKAASQQQQQNRQGNQQQGQPDKQGQAGKSGNQPGKNSSGQGKNGSQGNQGSQGSQSSQGKQGNQGKSSSTGDKQSQQNQQQSSGNKQGDQGQGSDNKNQSKNNGQGNQQDRNSKATGKNGEASDKTADKQGNSKNQEQRGEGDNNENEKNDKAGDKENRDQQAQQGNNRKDERNEEGNQRREQEQSGTTNSPPPPPPPPSPTPSAMSWDWLKWLGYGLLIAGILFALWKWGRPLWQALLQLWREIIAWWQGLIPAKQQEPETEESSEVDPHLPPKPFAWFSNPLHNPSNFRSMEEMIRYSFAALHSWAYEQKLGRHPDETPTEFAQRLGASIKHAHQDIRKLTDLYSVITYARVQAPTTSETILRNFWNRVTATQYQPAEAD